ncbi:MAG: OsmC family protein [Actinomycetota bacterium]
MTGTFGSALEARKIEASGGKLTTEVTGEIELEDGVLVIKRIHAHYTLRGGDGVDGAVVERVHGFHARRCPVARSLQGAIEVTTSYELT